MYLELESGLSGAKTSAKSETTASNSEVLKSCFYMECRVLTNLLCWFLNRSPQRFVVEVQVLFRVTFTRVSLVSFDRLFKYMSKIILFETVVIQFQICTTSPDQISALNNSAVKITFYLVVCMVK